MTSTYHVFRSRLLFGRCLHGGVTVVGAGQPPTLPLAVVIEAGKLLWAATVDRDCQ